MEKNSIRVRDNYFEDDLTFALLWTSKRICKIIVLVLNVSDQFFSLTDHLSTLEMKKKFVMVSVKDDLNG